MRIDLKSFARPTATVKLWHTIWLFVLLQTYFVSNTLSFGIWRSGPGVFVYMLLFYGLWLVGLSLLLSLFLAAGRRFSPSWLVLVVLVVLSIPFSWELWVRSLEIDSSTTAIFCIDLGRVVGRRSDGVERAARVGEAGCVASGVVERLGARFGLEGDAEGLARTHQSHRGYRRAKIQGSSRGSRFEEVAHGLLGAPGVVSMGLGEVVESAFQAHDGDGDVGQAGEVARQVSGVHAAPVLVVGDVAHVVDSVLESPIGLLLFQSKFLAFQISIQHTETRQ